MAETTDVLTTLAGGGVGATEAEVIQTRDAGEKPRAAEDKLLDQLFKKYGVGSDEPPAPAPAPSEAETEAAPGEPEAAPEANDEGSVGEETPGKEARPDLASALQNLRVAGFTAEDLEGMTDERLISLGAKQAKMEKDRKEHVRKLTADLKAAKESVPEVSKVDSTESAELAEETTATLREQMRPLAEDFGWEDSHVDALTKLVSKAAQDATAPLRRELEATQHKLERANEAAFQALFDNARRQLGERIPRLRDQATFKEKVEPQLAKLDASSYESVEDILLDAARIAGLRIYKTREEAESTAKDLSQAKANGKPTTASRAHAPEDMSAEDRADAIFDHLFDHPGDTMEAKRLYATQ